MQPDENDIIYTSYGIDTNIFKLLYDLVTGSGFSYDSFMQLLIQLWTVYSVLAFLASLAFIVGIVYSYIRLNQFSEIEEESFLKKEEAWQDLHNGNIEDTRWKNAQTHLESTNPNDWKLAIIEADVLLERMLEKAGYAGATIGEKLKSATVRTFRTIDDAWDAHRVRNQIAHGGADFVLTHKIAKETLLLYERVFKEFDLI